MRKLWLGLLLLLGAAPALAQPVTMPPPAGTAGILCAYNTAPAAAVDGMPYWVQCGPNGALLTGGSGVVNTANSSTANLGGGAAFTGTAVDVSAYAKVSLSVFSDQNSAASATAGVTIQWSPNGTNWDDASVWSFVAGSAAPNAGQIYEAAVRNRYMRIVYTNGATPQTSFRLQTMLFGAYGGGDIQDVGQRVSSNSHAQVTASVISALSGTNYIQILADSIGNLRVATIGITPTDRTITSASGSSQQIMAANAARHSMTVVNTGNANCGVNPAGGTAAIAGAGTITLGPLGSYTPRVPTLSAVTVICTAGQPIYADEN